MLIVEVTQFIPPNGRTKDLSVEVPDELADKYHQMRSFGLRLTVERLMTDAISLCIENPQYGDFKMKLYKHNGPDRNDELIEIIKEFDVDEYASWLTQAELEEDSQNMQEYWAAQDTEYE